MPQSDYSQYSATLVRGVPMRSRRYLALSAVTSAALGLLAAPPLLTRAAAAAPTAIAVTQTAPRNFGNGGPAVGADTTSGAVAAASDGGLLFWDGNAYEIRRVHPTTGTVTAIAGTGVPESNAAQCSALNTTTPASTLPLANVQGLWTDAAGDVFMWQGISPCNEYGNVYRLDPNDHLWHIAVQNRGVKLGAFAAAGVDGQGDVFVSDVSNHVIRKFAYGADPTSAGVVVAGTVGASGTSGNGVPATTAKIADPRMLAVAANGSFVISSGRTIRRVDATTGLITTVAGTGTAPPTGQPSADDGMPATQARIVVSSIAISPDGQTVYFYGNSGGKGADRTFPVGGTIHTVVGPAATSAVAKAPGAQMAPDPTHAGQLIVSTAGELRRWPVDGSAATQPGVLVAGLPLTDGHAASADGTVLSDAFVPAASVIAQAPNGKYAIATEFDIRGLSGLSSTDTLSTLSHASAAGLAYAADSTLYALRCAGTATNNCKVRKIVPGGTDARVFGGGANPLSDGAVGTQVGLPYTTSSIAIDQSTRTLYAVTGGSGASQVWSLNLSTRIVHLVAGSGSNGNPIDTADARTAPLTSVRDVAVDQTTHNIYLDMTGTPGDIYEVLPSGSLKVLGGSTAETSPNGLSVGPDGTLYLDGFQVESFGTDGATSEQVPGLRAVSTVRHDGSLVGLPVGAGDSGGLLAYTPVMPAPAYPGPLPTISATPGATSVSVSVAPPATSGDTVTVRELPGNSSVVYPNAGNILGTFTTDGTTTPRTFDVESLSPGTTYRFDAIISDQSGNLPFTFASAAPQRTTATVGTTP
jgi:hypothetical protein